MHRRIQQLVTVITGAFLFVAPVQAASDNQVIIDPGHGGKFTGTAGYSGNQTGYYEKDANLEVALKLREILSNQGYIVNMTRDRDRDFASSQSSDLAARMNIANSYAKGNRANSIFISIHHNARADASVRGYETYYFDIENGINEHYPPDPLQVHYSPESRRLAQTVHSVMLDHLPTNEGAGIVTNNLFVTRNAQMPSVLVELGYMSNPEEEQLIKSDEFQQQAAKGLAEAIGKYFEGYESRKIAGSGKKYKVVHETQGFMYSSWGLGPAIDFAKRWRHSSVYGIHTGQLMWSNYMPEVYEVKHSTQGVLFDSYLLWEAIDYAEKWKHTAVYKVETDELMWSNYLPPVYEVKHNTQGVLYRAYQLDNAIDYAEKWRHTSVFHVKSDKLMWSNYLSAPFEVVHSTQGFLYEAYQLQQAIDYAKKWKHTAVINTKTEEILWDNY